ncbi:hypothetical protein ACLIBG_03625, partial [Virgibacillus sp. W0181]|uniref:hypothetical protein n=1 Tax=Virgibacillus sp. W0181 TaxID=3391581 RepID=UPI003F45D995
MRKRWNKIYTITSIALLVVTALVYTVLYVNVISPLAKQAKSTAQEVELYEKQVAKLTEQKDNIQEQKLNEVAMKVPLEKTPETVLRQLEKLAKTSKVEVTSLGTNDDQAKSDSDAEEETTNDLKQIEYRMEVKSGNIAAINTFMETLLEAERFF